MAPALGMAMRWSDPKPGDVLDRQDPYVHWWHAQEHGPTGPAQPDRYCPCPVQPLFADTPIAEDFDGGAAVYVPAHAANPEAPAAWSAKALAADLPADLAPETVLVGVIDTGIALGHRRFRGAAGQTRVVAAWQQTARFIGQADLPFGQEVYGPQIDAALHAHSLGDTGRLDEEAFNRALHLVEPDQRDGHRDLDYRAAHGTHVLDLVAGADPRHPGGQALSDLARIIAVNLPAQRMHGSAGNFLVYWALYAVKRILLVADALALANAKTAPEGGYPVVINFSYGMQAGPKDGTSAFETALEAMLDARQRAGCAPVRVVMPVGNDNLDRCRARAVLGPDTGPFQVPWRISPNDRTSNHVELWLRGAVDAGAFTLKLSPPGMDGVTVPPLQPGQWTDLGDFARVYRRRDAAVQAYVLCVAPTDRVDHPALPLAPAGLWQVDLHSTGAACAVDAYIQSDQSGLRHSPTGRMSYFDHPKDRSFTEAGAWRDSFDYATGADTDALDVYGPVSMTGTQNALATSGGVVVVGGYRASDGKPAPYSATVQEDGPLDAACPSEISPALFGQLAAGSRDGSAVALRGTSMASALAARRIVQHFIAQRQAGAPAEGGDGAWLRDAARLAETEVPVGYRPAAALKVGAGRLPSPHPTEQGRPPRRL